MTWKDEKKEQAGALTKEFWAGRGYTQNQLAVALDVNVETAQSWEQGVRTPDMFNRTQLKNIGFEFKGYDKCLEGR